MSYLQAMIRRANPNVDFDGVTKKSPLISPIPRVYNKYHEPVFEDHPSFGWSIRPDGTEVAKDFTDGTGIGYNSRTLAVRLEEVKSNLASRIAINYEIADKLAEDETVANWAYISRQWLATEPAKEMMEKYGFDKKVCEDLEVLCETGDTFTVPVINNNTILAIGHYHPDKESKWHYSEGFHGPLIVGFDQWVYNYDTPTLICEGQKDMMIARSKGYNAICFTNGAQAIPELYSKYFKNRICHIVYDNDSAGKKGARKLAVWLKEQGAASIKVVEGFHAFLSEKGDIYDWFQTIGKTKKELDEIIKDTNEFNENDYEEEVKKIYPVVTLQQALEKENIGKILQTDLLVISEWQASWLIPEDVVIMAKDDDDNNKLLHFEITNPRDFLKMRIPEIQQTKFIKALAKQKLPDGKEIKLTKNDEIISWTYQSREPMYACEVEPIINNWELKESGVNISLTAICFEKKPRTGKRYRFRYRIVSDPLTPARMVMLVEEFIPLDEKRKNFNLVPEMHSNLKKAFSRQQGDSVKSKFKEFYEDMKGYIGPRLDLNLWMATDLAFNSPLSFIWHGKEVRATLDTAIIGDGGFGKSYTFDHLQRLYQEGYKVSSENATVISIIGGTTTKDGTRKTTVGILGQQDEGLVCFEESTKLGEELIQYLNELRSSGRANVNRIDGNLQYSAKLRYIFIANQKEKGVKNMFSNPNGLIPIKSIFPKPEHRRRFDYILTTGIANPWQHKKSYREEMKTYKPVLRHPEEWYRARLQWIWSRTPEQIEFTSEVEDTLYDCFEWWDKHYWTGEALFGTNEDEFVLKLLRIATSVAAMLYNSPDSKKLVVTANHVIFAFENFYRPIYESDLFKIDEVAKLAKFEEIPDERDIAKIESLYNANEDNKLLIERLINNSEPQGKAVLQVYVPDRDRLDKIVNELMRYHFVAVDGDKYYATNKLKNGYRLINREKPITVEEEHLEKRKVGGVWWE